MRSLMLVLAVMLASGPVQAQSDETCIAYMEADDDFERSKRALYSSSSHRAADKACNQARLRENKMSGLDSSSPAFKEAKAERLRICKARILNLMRGGQEPYSKMWRAYKEAYNGLKSNNTNVMRKLIEADRERCRRRLER